jgi:hypothetical protein
MRNGLVAALALVGGVAFAQGKPAEAPAKEKKPAAAAPEKAGAPMEMPKPPAELEVEKWFDGKWKCEGTQHASHLGPEGKFTSALHIKMDIQGWWLNFHVEREKGFMPGAQVAGYAGYDTTTKKHVRTDFGLGGSWGTLTAAGWEGDKLVYSGEMMTMGKKMPLKHTFTKKGDSEFMSVYEMAGPDGKLMPVFEETCKKGGAKK